MGVSFDGAPCGNGQHGIYLNPGAVDSGVTGTVAGNNAKDGIYTLAPRTAVANCSVGVSLDGSPCGNGVSGIALEPGANDSIVTDTVAGNHPQTGMYTMAWNTSIVRNTVGASEGGRTSAPNLKYGIWVDAAATRSRVWDNNINNSGWSGLRVDPEDADVRNNTGNMDPDSHSGFALQACRICDCTDDGVSATVAVSCHNITYFGTDFPNSFPANTTRIDLSNTKLRMVDWQQLRQVRSTLRVLDLSLNPRLDTVSGRHGNGSDSPYRGFGQLVELNLDGTNLSRASNDTVHPIASQLRVLRLGNPSATPEDRAVSVNLTGTHAQLACLAWYDVSRCPVGYYSPVPAADNGKSDRRGGQCTRCPVGTYQPLTGAADIGDCRECPPGTVDGDQDPTTNCTASGFHVSSSWNPDLIAAPPATFTANEAYELKGVDRASWNNSMLFNGSQTGKVVFVVEVVNATDADATVYTNVKNGAATARVHAVGDWTLQLSATDGSRMTVTLASWKVRVMPSPGSSGPSTMVLVLSWSLGGTLLLVLAAFGVRLGRRARQKRAEDNTRRRLVRIAAGTARFGPGPSDSAEGGDGLPDPTTASTAVATAVTLGCEDIVPDLLAHGADPAARHPETHCLVHATLFARAVPNAPVLLELFRAHCEIDTQIGALVRDPGKFVVLQQSLVALARAQWRSPDGATPLHRVVDACRLQCLAEPAAVLLATALLAEDRTLLTAVDGRSRTPAAVAAECNDADELERLLAVVVFDRYQLLRAEGADVYEYRSATSVISRCRDLGAGAVAAIAAPFDVGSGGSNEPLVLKMMKDEGSWARELQSRCAFEGTDAEATTVPMRSAVGINRGGSNYITLSPMASRRVHRYPETVLQSARHELAFELMKEYPFAICMPLAERNLLEIIESERASGQPIGVLAFTARKIAVAIDNLHKAGIAHSDIKPRNIVRTKVGAFRLIDFDMAFCTVAVAGSGGAGLLPAAHASASKVRRSNAFAAPELVRWAEAASALPSAATLAVAHPVQLDIFSFGVTLYTLVAGAPLFEQSYDTLTTRALPTMLSWTGLSSDADAEAQLKMLHPGQDLTSLLDVLQWMLEADPANRPKSMAEVLGHGFFDSTGGTMREHFLVERIREKLADPASTRDCPSVMISYCWADTAFVLGKLVMALAGRVKGLWLDRLGGDQGMGAWARASMDRGVAGADVIIVVVSPKYTQSKNCGFEMELADKHKKEIIPIVLGLPVAGHLTQSLAYWVSVPVLLHPLHQLVLQLVLQ